MSLVLRVVQESAELTGVHVLQDDHQELLVEFEKLGMLLHDLPDAVDELEEYRRAILVAVFRCSMAHSLKANNKFCYFRERASVPR